MLAGETAPYQRIASGTFRDLEFGDGGRNHVRVVAIGDRGWLFINSNFVSSFDLGDVYRPRRSCRRHRAPTQVTKSKGQLPGLRDFKGLSIDQAVRPRRGEY